MKYAKNFGVMAAMREYDVQDYVCMLNFLKEQDPEGYFPMVQPEIDDFGSPNAFDKLLKAMLRKYSQLESENKALAEQNAELTKKLDYYKAVRWQAARPIVQGIMEYCKK